MLRMLNRFIQSDSVDRDDSEISIMVLEEEADDNLEPGEAIWRSFFRSDAVNRNDTEVTITVPRDVEYDPLIPSEQEAGDYVFYDQNGFFDSPKDEFSIERPEDPNDMEENFQLLKDRAMRSLNSPEPAPEPFNVTNETEVSKGANVDKESVQLRSKEPDSALAVTKKSDSNLTEATAKATEVSVQKQYSDAMQMAFIFSVIETFPQLYKYATRSITLDKTAKTLLKNYCVVTGAVLGGLTMRTLAKVSNMPNIPGLQAVAMTVGSKYGKEFGEYVAEKGNKLIDYYLAPSPSKGGNNPS